MITSTGLPPREVDVMSMREVGRLALHWRRFLPTHLAVAQFERAYLAMHGITREDTGENRRAPAPRSPTAADDEHNDWVRRANSYRSDEAGVRAFVAQTRG